MRPLSGGIFCDLENCPGQTAPGCLVKTKKVEFIICLVVIIWGLLITIFVVSAEYSNWRDNSEIRARLSKLEKCKSYGKKGQTEETKEAEKS